MPAHSPVHPGASLLEVRLADNNFMIRLSEALQHSVSVITSTCDRRHNFRGAFDDEMERLWRGGANRHQAMSERRITSRAALVGRLIPTRACLSRRARGTLG